ncbi:hypothetical protein DERP_003756 [Dermatophagoides pteronyssinus]|uniref:Uncharacterized protein n=1 Tax=Dermatophagoides pteronyssinus TaxID=6956 RepID=A0ABQ8JM28_DERPT|nr:hypothetical protein DERP_003756 [Dermatophagoides pteronyssinus]
MVSLLPDHFYVKIPIIIVNFLLHFHIVWKEFQYKFLLMLYFINAIRYRYKFLITNSGLSIVNLSFSNRIFPADFWIYNTKPDDNEAICKTSGPQLIGGRSEIPEVFIKTPKFEGPLIKNSLRDIYLQIDILLFDFPTMFSLSMIAVDSGSIKQMNRLYQDKHHDYKLLNR